MATARKLGEATLAEKREKLIRGGELKRKARRRDEDTSALWERVAFWRQMLARRRETTPAFDSLESAWEKLDEHYHGVVKREGERAAETPAEALFFHVEIGMYPPPELLLAVDEAYRVYLEGRGTLTLEECFFGRPPRKGGVLAKRRGTRSRYVHWGIKMQGYIEDGHSQIRAAEMVSEDLGGKPEPESILRLVTKHYPFILKIRINKPAR